MNNAILTIWIGVGLLGLGMSTAILRRQVLIVCLGLHGATLGALTVYLGLSRALERPVQTGFALAGITLSTALLLAGAAAAVGVFRRRNAHHVDELRELRG